MTNPPLTWQLQTALSAIPFVPFTVNGKYGRHFYVSDPSQLQLSPAGGTIFFPNRSTTFYPYARLTSIDFTPLS